MWALPVVIALVLAGACSGGSSGVAHRPRPTTTPSTSAPTTTPPTVTPTVAPTTVPPPAAGTVVVPASIDPTGHNDVTASMQRFIDSVPNGRDIQFRKGAQYRIEGTLFLEYRRQITIDGNGATVFATTRGARDRAQWWITRGTQIVFRNMWIRGANPHGGTGENAYVPDLEFQHGFRFEGVNGAELDHVQVHDVYGDFVYVGRDKHRVPCSDIWIHDSRFSRNGRQGISVTAASNVVIERNHFGQTRRATIDLEPSAHSWSVSNVFVLNNTVGKGRLLFVASHGQGPVSDVVISGNHLIGHSLTIDVMAASGSRRSNWVVVDNISDSPVHSRPMRFFGIDGLVVRGNRQLVDGGDPGVVLNDVCGARVSDNEFGAGDVRVPVTSCGTAFAVPVPDPISGRGAAAPTTSTSAPPTSVTAPPTATTAPSTVTTAPAASASSSGGFDLADWILVASGATLLLAIVLAWRARRPPVSRSD